jgi:hypothetical protein
MHFQPLLLTIGCRVRTATHVHASARAEEFVTLFHRRRAPTQVPMDVITYNAALLAAAAYGSWRGALSLLDQMQQVHIPALSTLAVSDVLRPVRLIRDETMVTTRFVCINSMCIRSRP